MLLRFDRRASEGSSRRRRLPPDYRSRRVEYRLLTLVGMLLLVLVLMNEARKPQRWRWLWALGQGGAAGRESDATIDTRLQSPDASSRMPSNLRITAADAAPTRIPETDPQSVPTIQDGLQAAAGPSDSQHPRANLPTTLDAAALAAVRDDTVFRSAENDAWFRLCERLQRTAEPDLKAASLGKVGFAPLYRQPQEYRGKLVTVSGTVRLGYYRSAPENRYGIAGYYTLWLRPTGGNSPIAVYALELPSGFPDVQNLEARGQRPLLAEEVEVTGYFFKRWAYRAQDGVRLAPLIVAKIPRWQPAPAASPPASRTVWSTSAFVACVAATLLFAVLFTLIVFLGTQRRRATFEDQLSAQHLMAFSRLEGPVRAGEPPES
jgi:hypothetical protein